MPLKLISPALPSQYILFDTLLIITSGLTVIVYVLTLPEHATPLNSAIGVTVMVTTFGNENKLVAIKLGMSPAPDAASPMAGSLQVQLYVAPEIVLEKVTAVVGEFAQTV